MRGADNPLQGVIIPQGSEWSQSFLRGDNPLKGVIVPQGSER